MTTGVVLAGGAGWRIGGDKPSVVVAGRPLLQWVVDALEPVVSRIVLTIAPGQVLPPVETTLPVVVCEDLLPARGPLTGIYTGLSCARAPEVLVVPCDAPLIRPALLQLLLSHTGFGAVVPEANGRLEAAFGVWSLRSTSAIVGALNGEQLSVRALLRQVDARIVGEDELRAVDPDLRSFCNVNTPGDVACVENLLRDGREA
ncbi:MAG: molybdenum cofactor guanylyltransferase [Dehalococcoidia bacterium]